MINKSKFTSLKTESKLTCWFRNEDSIILLSQFMSVVYRKDDLFQFKESENHSIPIKSYVESQLVLKEFIIY